MIEFDDLVIEPEGVWTQVCNDHIPDVFHMGEFDHTGHGLCGIKGCRKLANHYMDFYPEVKIPRPLPNPELKLGGFRKGTMTIIGAVRGTGKSMFAKIAQRWGSKWNSR